MKKLPFLIALLIIFGALGGCASMPQAVETAAPSPTLAPLPTETPLPTSTAPVASATGALEIPLGIGIYEAEQVAFFNRYAREEDVISARPPFMHLLEDVEVGRKMLNFNPRDEPLTDVDTIMAEARAMGVTILGYNLETALAEDQLVGKEREMQARAEENDLLYAFGPLIVKLMKNYDRFAPYADVLVLQSQRFQMTVEYESTVEDLIAEIKSINPDVEVWVLVSVNPPEQRHVTADEVIGDIRLVADKADLIWIYFGPRTAPVMEEVFKGLR